MTWLRALQKTSTQSFSLQILNVISNLSLYLKRLDKCEKPERKKKKADTDCSDKEKYIFLTSFGVVWKLSKSLFINQDNSSWICRSIFGFCCSMWYNIKAEGEWKAFFGFKGITYWRQSLFWLTNQETTGNSWSAKWLPKVLFLVSLRRVIQNLVTTEQRERNTY